jgi:DNA modification methylase
MAKKTKDQPKPKAVRKPAQAQQTAATVTAPWRNRITRYGEEAPDQLLAHELNYRIHPKPQQDALRGVLNAVGIVQNVIVSERSGKMLDGHLRVELALTDGQPTIPITFVDVDEDEERVILAALDATAAMAGTDQDILDSLIADIRTSDLGQELPEGLVDLLESLSPVPENAGLVDEDSVPEVPETPVTMAGDCWMLGDHKLVCGDSTDPECVARLMNGEKAKLLWTDPPYGVDYGALVSSRQNQKKGGWDDIAGDALDDEHLLALLTGSLAAPGATVAIVWHPPGARRFLFWKALETNGWKPSQEIVWVKNALVFGRADYQWRHEPCIYAKRGAAERQMDRTQTTVWEVDKPHNSEHPTQKPVELCALPIKNHTTPGDIVMDPFLGSGTAIIASEQLSRLCYGIEIKPAFVDVAISRWESFTGKSATLDSTGQTFAEVRASRLGTTQAEVVSERAEPVTVAA